MDKQNQYVEMGFTSPSISSWDNCSMGETESTGWELIASPTPYQQSNAAPLPQPYPIILTTIDLEEPTFMAIATTPILIPKASSPIKSTLIDTTTTTTNNNNNNNNNITTIVNNNSKSEIMVPGTQTASTIVRGTTTTTPFTTSRIFTSSSMIGRLQQIDTYRFCPSILSATDIHSLHQSLDKMSKDVSKCCVYSSKSISKQVSDISKQVRLSSNPGGGGGVASRRNSLHHSRSNSNLSTTTIVPAI
ncbi:hypothetical protein DFA_08972 [Cavenderia fasciculata]|uniref:Uncharacterized protein n=1 Tax=Cavenderia fasciculata TaxID=261658 RepID=F4Q6C4_CACFS|nr:uncharacterized protein DFA_08972 [Cavenderia fasciculata]EGG16434.1 hypothetical protein DFA_08972 [Cavenderia fasciculata]|eukprot:XP_004354834.1 hypothetical protein DFA_08972 [Cavenderia fasciculata]